MIFFLLIYDVYNKGNQSLFQPQFYSIYLFHRFSIRMHFFFAFELANFFSTI